jgi:hypothetical protein
VVRLWKLKTLQTSGNSCGIPNVLPSIPISKPIFREAVFVPGKRESETKPLPKNSLTFYTSSGTLPPGKSVDFSDSGSFTAAFSFPASQIPAPSPHRSPPSTRLPGADTLECGSWLPPFRRQIRTPAKHPQPAHRKKAALLR